MTTQSINSSNGVESSNGVGHAPTSSAIQQWLLQGETLYESAMSDYRGIETQLVDLEAKLAEKRMEVNQIAHLIGKPPAEGSRRLTAQLVEERDRSATAGATTHIARALAGKFGR
jgi:hypothetical protein